MNFLKKTLVALVLLSTKIATLSAIGNNYQLIDLGLNCHTSSWVTGINNNGWITGVAVDKGSNKIFVFDEERNKTTRWMNVDESYINNQNEIFGSYIARVERYNWIFDEEWIFQWKNPFKYFHYFNTYYLGYAPGHYSGPYNFVNNVVWDVNDHGQVLVMNSRDSEQALNELHPNKVWVYNNGNFVKLDDSQFTAGYKINNKSEILGEYASGSKYHKNRAEVIAIYDFKNSSVRSLTFPDVAWGIDLNDNSQVVGCFYDPHTETYKGFLLEPTNNYIELDNFHPIAINNKGQILGSYIYAEKKDEYAIWEDGVFYDLKDLVNNVDDKGQTWTIKSLVDINDEGYIIGNGIMEGQSKQHGFLIKPM